MNLLQRLAIVMAVITILITLLPIWYWAMFGMAESIGLAWFATGMVSFIVGGVCGIVGFE